MQWSDTGFLLLVGFECVNFFKSMQFVLGTFRNGCNIPTMSPLFLVFRGAGTKSHRFKNVEFCFHAHLSKSLKYFLNKSGSGQNRAQMGIY